MPHFTFSSHDIDPVTGASRAVTMSASMDSLKAVADLFLDFIRASDFPYVAEVLFCTEDGTLHFSEEDVEVVPEAADEEAEPEADETPEWARDEGERGPFEDGDLLQVVGYGFEPGDIRNDQVPYPLGVIVTAKDMRDRGWAPGFYHKVRRVPTPAPFQFTLADEEARLYLEAVGKVPCCDFENAGLDATYGFVVWQRINNGARTLTLRETMAILAQMGPLTGDQPAYHGASQVLKGAFGVPAHKVNGALRDSGVLLTADSDLPDLKKLAA